MLLKKIGINHQLLFMLCKKAKKSFLKWIYARNLKAINKLAPNFYLIPSKVSNLAVE